MGIRFQTAIFIGQLLILIAYFKMNEVSLSTIQDEVARH